MSGRMKRQCDWTLGTIRGRGPMLLRGADGGEGGWPELRCLAVRLVPVYCQ